MARSSTDVNFDNNDEQYVTRGDYQLNANHSIFARFFDAFERRPPKLAETHNIMTIQTTFLPFRNRRASMLALGDTQVFGANMVNSARFTFVKTKTRTNGGGIDGEQETFFDAADLGIPNVYTYVPHTMNVAVNAGDLRFSGNHTVAGKIDSKVYQVSDDFSRVWGRHQLGVGTSIQYSYFDGWDYASANGSFTFNGRITGLPLGDFMTGQMSSFSHGGPNINTNHQWYIGVYGQDAWTVAKRVTLNMGLRWDPYQGAVWENGTITNFSLDNFHSGVKSTMFPNAPPGLLFPGDPGFPPGKTGFNKQWWNFSPRAGLAWDVKGDARTAMRASYALTYDYPGQSFLQAAANVAPFNNRTNLSGNIPMDNPYSLVPGGPPLLPTPIPPPVDAVFPLFSSYTSMDPDINSIRVHSWNATIEQQIGTDWQVAASYLGGYMDRIWGRKNINPGVYLGPSSTAANIQTRRVFTLANPAVGQYYSEVFAMTAVGVQDYRGLKLSVRRRAAGGLSFNANYTLSHCETDSPYNGLFISQFEYHGSQQPVVRSRQLPLQSDPRRQCHGGISDSAVHQHGAARRGVRLARVGGAQRELGQLADRDHHLGSREDGRPSASESGEGQSVRRQDAGQLSRPGGLCDSGRQHAGRSPRQEYRGSAILAGQCGARARPACRRRADARTARRDVQPVQHVQLGGSGHQYQRHRHVWPGDHPAVQLRLLQRTARHAVCGEVQASKPVADVWRERNA